MESWLQRMMASRLPKFYEPCLATLLLAVEVFAGSRLCGRRSACGRLELKGRKMSFALRLQC